MLLSNVFIRLNPFWELKFETHHGLYRLYKNSIHEKPFNEFQIHLYTYISAAWKLHLSYGYTVKITSIDSEFTTGEKGILMFVHEVQANPNSKDAH